MVVCCLSVPVVQYVPVEVVRKVPVPVVQKVAVPKPCKKSSLWWDIYATCFSSHLFYVRKVNLGNWSQQYFVYKAFLKSVIVSS